MSTQNHHKPPELDYQFSNRDLLSQALRHRSASSKNNERLEFLGDSILNFCITEKLYQLKPGCDEGELSRIRASLVNGERLAVIAKIINLGEYIEVGPGERKSGAIRRKSILADAMEAIFGAVYLDGGFEVARKVILDLYDEFLCDLPDAERLKDPKTRLQEYLQARNRNLPVYTVVTQSGKDHNKQFEVRCEVEDIEATSAIGSSRRKAEQSAAKQMLEQISHA